MNRTCPSILIATLAALALAGPATAVPDTPVVADATANAVTALDGTIVWTSRGGGFDVLMQKTGDVAKRVKTTPKAKLYRGIDLGHDTHGKLVLTYLRCKSFGSCTAIRDDLRGHRQTLHRLVPTGCSLTTAPAIWGARIAAGADCKTDSKSGLYVKTGSALRHLPLPKDARKFKFTHLSSVDIAGTRVGGVVTDVYTYSFVETTSGKQIHSTMTADQEGDDDGNTLGFAITGSTAWALSTFAHAGDPNQSDIVRITPSCIGFESLENATEAEQGFKATDLAADGSKLYLLVPNTGIVRHTFVNQHNCPS